MLNNSKLQKHGLSIVKIKIKFGYWEKLVILNLSGIWHRHNQLTYKEIHF